MLFKQICKKVFNRHIARKELQDIRVYSSGRDNQGSI
jgi:hypothetical protein